MPHHTHAKRIDQRIPGVARVEVEFPADVGQAQAVAVGGDPADHAGQHPAGVRGIGRPEPDRVHHGHRACAHSQDVTDDAAHAGGRTLMRLHVRRMVVRFDLEGDRVAQADVHHAGVVADTGQQRAGRGRLIGELPQVHLRGFVGAVLAPHHGVQGQLGGGRAAAQGSHDPAVLRLGQAQLSKGLRRVRRRRRPRHRIYLAHASTPATTEVKKPRPSADGPVSELTACSGCGIRPTTLPAALQTPAMSSAEPFGFPLA